MEPVRIISGTAMPLDRSDVDTDQIIPAHWLKRIERTGFGPALFSAWRDDRDFVLNQPQYVGAQVLVSGPRFGTGSSREHAVWAILQYGFRAVVSPRFGDIFRNNATKNGLVPVQVSEESGELLMRAIEEDPTLEITVDVERQIISAPKIGFEESFPLDASIVNRLVKGLDDIAVTLAQSAAITSFEATRPSWAPRVRG